MDVREFLVKGYGCYINILPENKPIKLSPETLSYLNQEDDSPTPMDHVCASDCDWL